MTDKLCRRNTCRQQYRQQYRPGLTTPLSDFAVPWQGLDSFTFVCLSPYGHPPMKLFAAPSASGNRRLNEHSLLDCECRRPHEQSQMCPTRHTKGQASATAMSHDRPSRACGMTSCAARSSLSPKHLGWAGSISNDFTRTDGDFAA
jgi:hypothetical protein